MSGIAGIYHLDGSPADPALLRRMTDAVAHRGSDGEGHWCEGPVGLGHRRLEATPELLGEKQPATEGARVITADARLDNRNELIGALGLGDKPGGGITDAELILHAYARWEEECPARLLGDFAFAIWDGRARRLFAARDPIGVKPFHYRFDGRRFLWASEPRQILQDPGVPAEPNLALIGRYLLNDGSEREETLYRGILRLPPAHSLTLTERGIQTRRYWDADPSREIRYRTDADYAEHFRDLFRRAVRDRLRSLGPVGAFLSGGLDSSSVVAMAQALSEEGQGAPGGLETYSIVFDTLPCDERRYVEAVRRRWGLRANLLVFEALGEAIDLGRSRFYPDVLYDPMAFAYAPALADARRKGMKVLLWGHGGDELLASGFEHLTDLLFEGRLRTVIAQLRHDAAQYAVPRRTLAWRYCVKPLIPSAIKSRLKPLVQRLRGDGIPCWFSHAFLRRTGLDDPWRRGYWAKNFPTRSQQTLYEGIGFSWNATVGLATMEALAGAFSAEFRYPFLDLRLVEFALAIPKEQRWWMDQPKAVLRRALDGLLPDEIRDRKGKAEFTPPFDREIAGRQAEQVEALLRESALERLGVVEGERLRRLFAEYRKDPRRTEASGVISTIVGLELWLRTLADERRQTDGA